MSRLTSITQSDVNNMLNSGWSYYEPDFDLNILIELIKKEPSQITNILKILGDLGSCIFRNEYPLIIYALRFFSDEAQDIIKRFNYIYSVPIKTLNIRDYSQTFNVTDLCNNPQKINMYNSTIRLQDITYYKTLITVLDYLGKPDLVYQYVSTEENDYTLVYDISKFVSFSELYVGHTLYAYWEKYDVWLSIINNLNDLPFKCYRIYSNDFVSISSKCIGGLTILATGSIIKSGNVNKSIPLESYTEEIQSYTSKVHKHMLDTSRTSMMLHGKPGTGKTSWALSFYEQKLKKLGFVLYILDADNFSNFTPEWFMQNVCIIVNEADNLAIDRAKTINNPDGRTERVLQILDGTMTDTLIEENQATNRKIVTIFTCNDITRFDEAFFRKGRLDFVQEFTTSYVN